MDISSATAQVAPDLLKDLAIMSDKTVRRSAVDQQDLKPYWKSEKSEIRNETFQQSCKQDSSDIHWRVQLICMKGQAHNSLEP